MRNKNEFQLYTELFEALEESMDKVSELVRKKAEAEMEALRKKRAAITGKSSGGMKGSSQ